MSPQERINELEQRAKQQSDDNWPLKVLKLEATVAYKQAQMFFHQGKMDIYPLFAKRFEQLNKAIDELHNPETKQP